ncbi:MAG: hypothetical protein Q4E76_04850 [Tissierellia bacterium]|nr:hypothetical protein [Tissierellia bacterium]
MNTIERSAYGKINIGLRITGKRADSYHSLETLFLPIELHDELVLERGGLWAPPFGREDLMSRAKGALEGVLGRDFEVSVSLKKGIPLAAGLAGGTADGAALLWALVELFQLEPPLPLEEIARPLGADFAYMTFLQGGNFAPVLGRGIGDELEPLKEVAPVPLILINPGFGISTPEAYRHWERAEGHYDPLRAHQLLLARDYGALGEVVVNDLATYIKRAHPQVREMEEALYREGAAFAQMTGSGPTVYGIFSTPLERDRAYEKLRDKYPTVIRTTGGGRGCI